MAGDRKAYAKAIREGLNLAWEGEWERALEAYARAAGEQPDDPVVHSYMGLAHLELGQYEPAMAAYSAASRLAPDDPAPLARIAEIHERLGQRHAAADALCTAAEIHQRRRSWKEAIVALQRATQLNRNLPQARMALARIYSEVDQPQRAAKEYLGLARSFRQAGQVKKALEQCRLALENDPRNLEARALAQALQRGEPLEAVEPAPPLAEEMAVPLEKAREKALEELASIPFEEMEPGSEVDSTGVDSSALTGESGAVTASRAQVDALMARAIDFQTRGRVDDAIASHAQAIDAGVDLAAAHFNLGLLYQQRLQLAPAVAELKLAVQDEQYALASHLALGECCKAMGHMEEASQHYVQVLKIIDLLTVPPERSDDLAALYDKLADRYMAAGDSDSALALSDALLDFLSEEEWEHKAREARQRLDSMSGEGVFLGLAEFLTAPSAETILLAMALSQEYAKQGAFTAAAEVCYEAIESAPTYVPLHLRLAEVFADGKRTEDAVAKYQMVAEIHLVREETGQAVGVYRRLLRLQPLDVAIRSRLIDLLVSSGEIDQALEEYIALADAYYDLAQVDKSLEKYAEALRLAPRASAEEEWRLRLLRNMRDIHVLRGDWREAIRVCLNVLAIAPDDERARLDLIDLNCKLGRIQEADKQTVAMISHYHSQGEDERGLALLREAVRLQPQQMPLRARMARAYIDAGMRQEAIQELDALGELQLDAGLRKQALATVRFIISLNPENVDAYRQLLDQL